MKYISNISDRVVAAEKRAAVIYAKTDGKLYKWLKILYVIAMVISIVMSLFYIGGRASHLYEIEKLGLNILSTTDINAVKTSLITVGICAVIWVISALLIKFKGEIISAVLTVAAGIVSCASLISASRGTAQFNEGINDNFWYRHFIPLFIAVFFIVWMVIVKLRQEFKFRRAYTNMVNRIYQQFHSEDLSEDEWEDFLKTYDPRAEEEKRRRKKKGIAEYKPLTVEENDKE